MGYKAAAQSDHNPQNTLYDAKRFIGKKFTKSELESEAARYPFQVLVIQIPLCKLYYMKLLQHMYESSKNSVIKRAGKSLLKSLMSKLLVLQYQSELFLLVES